MYSFLSIRLSLRLSLYLCPQASPLRDTTLYHKLHATLSVLHVSFNHHHFSDVVIHFGSMDYFSLSFRHILQFKEFLVFTCVRLYVCTCMFVCVCMCVSVCLCV